MPTVLIVCTGNTCRSPVAEGVLKSRLAERGRGDWVVHSAGVNAQPGQPATPEGGRQLQIKKGIDIGSHRSKKLTQKMIEDADLVLCMTKSHRANVVRLVRWSEPKAFLLADVGGGQSSEVPDPYGGTEEDYKEMVETVVELIDHGLPQIIKLAKG